MPRRVVPRGRSPPAPLLQLIPLTVIGKTRWARSEIHTRPVSTPAASSSESSWSSVSGFTTVPAPMRQMVPGWNTPAGTRCSRKVPYSLTTVCPALSPPWTRITISAVRLR
jgi:hypothetical protein